MFSNILPQMNDADNMSNFDLSNRCKSKRCILIHRFAVPRTSEVCADLPWGRLTQSETDSDFVAVKRLFGYRQGYAAVKPKPSPRQVAKRREGLE